MNDTMPEEIERVRKVAQDVLNFGWSSMTEPLPEVLEHAVSAILDYGRGERERGIEEAKRACGGLMLEGFPGPRQALAEAVRRVGALASAPQTTPIPLSPAACEECGDLMPCRHDGAWEAALASAPQSPGERGATGERWRPMWIEGAAAVYRHEGRSPDRAMHLARWLLDVTHGPPAPSRPERTEDERRCRACVHESDEPPGRLDAQYHELRDPECRMSALRSERTAGACSPIATKNGYGDACAWCMTHGRLLRDCPAPAAPQTTPAPEGTTEGGNR